jgi:hypothetical protein
VFERHEQAIGDSGDEDVRLNTLVGLMEDRPDGQIVFEFFERLLYLRKLNVVLPQRLTLPQLHVQQTMQP